MKRERERDPKYYIFFHDFFFYIEIFHDFFKFLIVFPNLFCSTPFLVFFLFSNFVRFAIIGHHTLMDGSRKLE